MLVRACLLVFCVCVVILVGDPVLLRCSCLCRVLAVAFPTLLYARRGLRVCASLSVFFLESMTVGPACVLLVFCARVYRRRRLLVCVCGCVCVVFVASVRCLCPDALLVVAHALASVFIIAVVCSSLSAYVCLGRVSLSVPVPLRGGGDVGLLAFVMACVLGVVCACGCLGLRLCRYRPQWLGPRAALVFVRVHAYVCFLACALAFVQSICPCALVVLLRALACVRVLVVACAPVRASVSVCCLCQLRCHFALFGRVRGSVRMRSAVVSPVAARRRRRLCLYPRQGGWGAVLVRCACLCLASTFVPPNRVCVLGLACVCVYGILHVLGI